MLIKTCLNYNLLSKYHGLIYEVVLILSENLSMICLVLTACSEAGLRGPAETSDFCDSSDLSDLCEACWDGWEWSESCSWMTSGASSKSLMSLSEKSPAADLSLYKDETVE